MTQRSLVRIQQKATPLCSTLKQQDKSKALKMVTNIFFGVINASISMIWLLLLCNHVVHCSVASEPTNQKVQNPKSLLETSPTPDHANRQKHATVAMRGTLCEGERWLHDSKIVVRCLKAAFRKILTVLTDNNEDFFQNTWFSGVCRT